MTTHVTIDWAERIRANWSGARVLTDEQMAAESYAAAQPWVERQRAPFEVDLLGCPACHTTGYFGLAGKCHVCGGDGFLFTEGARYVGLPANEDRERGYRQRLRYMLEDCALGIGHDSVRSLARGAYALEIEQAAAMRRLISYASRGKSPDAEHARALLELRRRAERVA